MTFDCDTEITQDMTFEGELKRWHKIRHTTSKGGHKSWYKRWHL